MKYQIYSNSGNGPEEVAGGQFEYLTQANHLARNLAKDNPGMTWLVCDEDGVEQVRIDATEEKP